MLVHLDLFSCMSVIIKRRTYPGLSAGLTEEDERHVEQSPITKHKTIQKKFPIRTESSQDQSIQFLKIET